MKYTCICSRWMHTIRTKRVRSYVHTATRCNVLQYTATHCNTLQCVYSRWMHTIGTRWECLSFLGDSPVLLPPTRTHTHTHTHTHQTNPHTHIPPCIHIETPSPAYPSPYTHTHTHTPTHTNSIWPTRAFPSSMMLLRMRTTVCVYVCGCGWIDVLGCRGGGEGGGGGIVRRCRV